jgi:hypothetical protein
LNTHNSELSEKEVRQSNTFIIAQKTVKYLGTNLTKRVKDLYTKNCKAFKKLNEAQTNEKIAYVHGLGDLIWIKCPHCPKSFTESMQPYQYSSVILFK